MFQNIKKYAAANKPQAAKMAQATVKNVGDQAANIGKSVERQQKAFQSSLQQQQGKVQQAQDFTSGVVQSITGGGQQAPAEQPSSPSPIATTPEERQDLIKRDLRPYDTNRPAPSSEYIKGTPGTGDRQTLAERQAPAEQPEFSGPSAQDFTKFREHLTGGAGQFGDVSELNIAKQQQEAKNLNRMAQGAETGQGRRELLKNTFAKQNPYTAGMQGLDDLIVSSDKDARAQMSQGTKDIAEKQSRNLAETRSQAMKDLSGYDRSRNDFSKNVLQQLTEGSTQFTDKAEQAAQANRVERQALADQLGITEEQAGQYMEEQFTGRGRNALTDAVRAIGGQVRKNTANQKMIEETVMVENPSKFGPSMIAKPTGRMIENVNYDPNASEYLVGRGGTWGNKYSGGDKDDTRFYTKGLYSSQHFGRPTDVYSKQFSDADLELLGMEKGDLGFDIRSKGYAGSKTKDSWNTKARHSSAYDVGRMRSELDRLASSVEDKTGRDAILASLARGGMESTGELGAKYDELLAGQDISAQSSASEDTISRYNALQDLMQGMGIGDRSLQEGSSAIGASTQNQEALAKMRADILKRIGQGEA
jgi:hypothetical protein